MGGVRRGNWDRHKANAKVSRDREAAIAERDVTSVAYLQAMHVHEIEWLERLLARPELKKFPDREVLEAFLLRTYEWLKEGSARVLHTNYRQKLGRVERMFDKVAAGHPAPTLGPVSPEKRRQWALASAAAKERKAAKDAQTPEWFKDPSKLPKKPPGRA